MSYNISAETIKAYIKTNQDLYHPSNTTTITSKILTEIANLVGSDGFLDDSADFEILFVLSCVDVNQLESSLDIVQDSESQVALGDFDNVHESDRVFGVSSDFPVDSNQTFLLLEDFHDLKAIEGETEFISQDNLERE